MNDLISVVLNALPAMLQGAQFTVLFTVASLFFGFILALLVAALRLTRSKIVNALARGYVSAIRGTPLLVQIYLIYFGLPSLGVALEPIPAGILALSLNVGAYLSESLRGAIQGVERGQWDAARSLGMSWGQTLRFIVLPQAFRVALPSVGNSAIGLVKDTSLVSVITVTELLRATQEAIASSFQPLPLYISAALVYWIISSLLGLLQGRLERRFNRSRAEGSGSSA
ncbi:MAG: amino acid ABC transporter permease [Pseudopedobacter sp.]|nr:amino acid ABC transporter permease [Deinococcales bacterium]